MTVVCERVGVLEALLGAGLVALTTARGHPARRRVVRVLAVLVDAVEPAEGGRRGCR